MLNNDVTELVTEIVLPQCDDAMFIGKESLNAVRFWYLVPKNLMAFFVDLWELGIIECLILFHGPLFAGCAHKKLHRLELEGQNDASRIKQGIEALNGT